MANIACSRPAGNGGVMRWPLTKCVSVTRIGVVRPGRASAGDGIRDFLEVKNIAWSIRRAPGLVTVMGDGHVAPRYLRKSAQGFDESLAAAGDRRGASCRYVDDAVRAPRRASD